MSRADNDIQSMPHHSSEERPPKRRSRSNPDDGNEIPYLPEPLLEEIIIRLPLKSIFRFKCVSKSWLSRLSEPSFAQKYRSWTLLWAIMYDKHDEVLSSNGFVSPTISYIHLPLPPRAIIRILASANGLLLCGNSYEGCYYLCNPFTQQMLRVPKPPTTWSTYQVEGLVTRMDELGVDVKSCKVVQVRMFDYAKPWSLDVFCSESGTWTTYQAYAPHDPKCVLYRHRIFSKPISLKETLYIPDDVEGVIMAYSPYADPCKLHLIHLPDRDDVQQVLGRERFGFGLRRKWGTCGGRLRYHYSLNLANRGPIDKVWELVDDREGEWRLVHSSLTGSNDYVQLSQSLLSMEYSAISFDPN